MNTKLDGRFFRYPKVCSEQMEEIHAAAAEDSAIPKGKKIHRHAEMIQRFKMDISDLPD